jgi:transposase
MQYVVPEATPGGRPEVYPKREILNGLFSLLCSGWSWRLLPHDDLPPWPIVYDYLCPWRQDGTWQVMRELLRGVVHVGRQAAPAQHWHHQ